MRIYKKLHTVVKQSGVISKTKQGRYIWPAECPSIYTKISSEVFEHTEYISIDLSQHIPRPEKKI